MKATGIIRRIDELGRVTLPVELRHSLGLKMHGSVEIYVDGDSIVLKKYAPRCVFCDSDSSLIVFKGKNVCRKCARDIGEKAEPPRRGAIF